MATKPSTVPTWATSATGIAATTDPTAPVRVDGWAVNQRVPSPWLNWLLNAIGAWIDYFKDGTAKAWAIVEGDGFGSVTLDDSSNVASVLISGGILHVTFSSAFAARDKYCVIVNGEGPAWLFTPSRFSSTELRVSAMDLAGGAISLSATPGGSGWVVHIATFCL